MSAIKEIITKYLSDIEETIQAALVDTPPFIRGVISYHFGWVDQNFEPVTSEKGKVLRPTVCLLVFEALTGGYRDALPVAAGLEMIHNFTLLHDDIEDNDLERRGRPTAWSIWGKPLVINIGDFLYTLAFHQLHQLDPTRFTAETILGVQRLVTRACLDLTMGQDLDLRFEQSSAVSTEMYLDMVYKKTGALLEASIVSGAQLGTADEVIINHYRQFAQNIGIAFQVRDDILGIWGDSAETGKSADNDLRRKKKTLPVLYTLGHLSGQRQTQLKNLYANPDPLSDDQIEFVRDCLESAQAHHYAQTVANDYIEKSFTALDRVGVTNQAQSQLQEIARFLVSRSR